MAGKDTRTKILEKAVELFSKKGYDAVGVQEIADQCGLTKPSLYYHFNSKAGILEGIMNHYIKPNIEELEKAVEESDDFGETLRNFSYCFVLNGCKNISLYMLMMTMQYAPPMSELNNAFVRHCTGYLDLAVSIFKEARPVLGNMNGRERQFATTLLAVLGFHIYTCRFEDVGHIDKAEIDLLIHQFLHGIYS